MYHVGMCCAWFVHKGVQTAQLIEPPSTILPSNHLYPAYNTDDCQIKHRIKKFFKCIVQQITILLMTDQ